MGQAVRLDTTLFAIVLISAVYLPVAGDHDVVRRRTHHPGDFPVAVQIDVEAHSPVSRWACRAVTNQKDLHGSHSSPILL
jgi:hypothetical protein